MAIGIYALKFNDLIYIGKSNCLNRRKKDHLTSMSKGTANYKILEAFTKYGNPEFIIIEECSITELNTKEVFWIAEFNSIKTGLNISSGGDGGGSGVSHNRAVHSEETIRTVFEMLINENIYTYKYISEITGVSVSTIGNIVNKTAHMWLEEAYKDSYFLLDKLKICRKNKANQDRVQSIVGIPKGMFKYPDIKDPEGNIYTDIINAKQFAEQHNLTPEGLCRLFSGDIKSHRQWKLNNATISRPCSN